jgi:hypothetical protein
VFDHLPDFPTVSEREGDGNDSIDAGLSQQQMKVGTD